MKKIFWVIAIVMLSVSSVCAKTCKDKIASIENEIEKIDLLINFLKDKSKQGSVRHTGALTFETADKNNFDHYSFEFATSEKNLNNPFDYLINTERYVYQIDKDGTPKPVGFGKIQKIENKNDAKVLCGGKKYYDGFKIAKTAESDEIIFSENIKWITNRKNDETS